MTDPENPEEKVQAAPTSPEDAPSEFSPETVVGNLVKEAQESRDKLLRTLAEMENLRKRTEREVADARSLRRRHALRATSSTSPTTCIARSKRCRPRRVRRMTAG